MQKKRKKKATGWQSVTASRSGVNEEPTKDKGRVTEQKECEGDRVDET